MKQLRIGVVFGLIVYVLSDPAQGGHAAASLPCLTESEVQASCDKISPGTKEILNIRSRCGYEEVVWICDWTSNGKYEAKIWSRAHLETPSRETSKHYEFTRRYCEYGNSFRVKIDYTVKDRRTTRNPVATISYTSADVSRMEVIIFDKNGNEIRRKVYPSSENPEPITAIRHIQDGGNEWFKDDLRIKSGEKTILEQGRDSSRAEPIVSSVEGLTCRKQLPRDSILDVIGDPIL